MSVKASLLADLLLLRRAWASHEPGAASMHGDLYALIKREILAGTLTAGTQLPPSRLLAHELGVSRNTVVYAYEQLLAEGYATAGTGRGTFVAEIAAALAQQRARLSTEGAASVTPALSQRGARLLERPGASSVQWGAFVPGVPDVSLFPHPLWQRLLVRHWRRPLPEMLTYSSGGGHPALRQALAQHLRIVRSVRCSPRQIIITAGIHQAIDLVTRLLGDVGDLAWVEEPGYWGIRNVLVSNGLRVRPVPVDMQGMAPGKDLLMSRPPPRFIFTTPSHQYPLGTVMSLSRRLLLIDYARRAGCWLVEDDYDSEFRFEGRPLASLQGIDVDDRVIYMGTFSKTLFPGLRIGFLVLPLPLVEPAGTALSELFREGQVIQQAVLADFIQAGYYAAHIRRMRQIYGQRHALLRAAIERHLGPCWPVASHDAGLHLVLGLPDQADDVAISDALRGQGITVRPLSRYYEDRAHARKGLLMGYACVDDALIDAGVKQVAAVIGAQARGI